jgi:hypothetical protein
MDLKATIATNKRILALIQSKYQELWPAAYNTPEARYYRMLERDTAQAEAALTHSGLASPPTNPD